MQSTLEIRNTPPALMDLLASGKHLACTWLALGSPALVEIALHTRPDAIVLDRQHGLWERSSIEAAIGFARLHVPVIVRVAENSATAIAEALDAGAASALIPLVESAEQVRAAISHGRYPPRGTRSAGGLRPLLGGIEAMLQRSGGAAIGVMIETVAGVEQAEAIAAVPGLDYLFIGTGDLVLSHGGCGPEVIERDCLRVLAAARAHGVPCGIFTTSPEDALRQRAAGFQVVVAANDIEIARAGFESANGLLRQSVGATDSSL